MSKSDIVLTSTLPIYFRVSSGDKEHADLAREITGGPPELALREFTRAYWDLGTKQNRELEKVLTEDDEIRERGNRESGKSLPVDDQREKHITPWRHLRQALLLLARVELSKSPQALYEAALLLVGDYLKRPEFSGWKKSVKRGALPLEAARLYGDLLNGQMEGATFQLVPVKPGQLPVPAIVCPDLRTAAFVHDAYRVTKVCSGCQRIFVPNPEKDQKYCSLTCAGRIYQRRHRRRLSKSRQRRKQ